MQFINTFSQTFMATDCVVFFLPWRNSPRGPKSPHCRGFTITLRHTTFGRTPLDEWSARRRDLCLTTHNTYKRQPSIPLAGFEPTMRDHWHRQLRTLPGRHCDIQRQLRCLATCWSTLVNSRVISVYSFFQNRSAVFSFRVNSPESVSYHAQNYAILL